MSKGKYYFSKSLEKGLKILSLFSRETPILTQSEIARKLALNMTSTYRYINTLVELKYLEKDAKTKEIRPSIICLLFCSNLMRATDRLRMVRAVVDQIHSENNISIDVAFVVNETLVRIYHRDAEETLIYRLPDFSRDCLHNTALGKAYLSSLSEEQIEKNVGAMELVAKTGRTIVDKAALIEDLKKAKARGYSVAEEEYLLGLLAIGAPLYDSVSGKGVGAVSFDFSILQHSVEEIEEKYARMIQEAARTLSDILPPDN
jgi:IclR family transcriptional regulator, pca regulon regulatory protein